MSPQSASQGVAAAGLRHELRTPLNHVIGYAEILLEEFPDSGLTEMIGEIRREADRMLDEIQQIAGPDKTSVSEAGLERLRSAIGEAVVRMNAVIRLLRTRIPDGGAADLDRIEAAAGNLLNALSPNAKTAEPVRFDVNRPAQVNPASGRILVVDDNELNRDMLCRQLEKQQHEVATASGGVAALALLRESRFDIMLLDLMMPGMNGFEVLAEVKNDPSLSGVAVILISALDEMEGVVRSIEAGAEDYLFKPVNPTLLRARVKSTLDKIRAEETVRRKQRLESIGLLAAGIAHDFNNLLTGIIGHAQLLDQVLTDESDREMAQSIVTAGERAAELTRQLLAYSGKAMFQMQPVDLVRMIRDAEGLIAASLPKRTQLRLNLAPVPSITADKNQLLQAVLNLAVNAAEAIGTDKSGTVCIETGVDRIENAARFNVMPDAVAAGWYVWLEVRDDGCGMDAATVDKIFEPFFSTKFLGRGLGLAAVSGIVRSHKGMLRVTSASGGGSAMRLYFPVVAGEEPKQEDEAGPAVLVVDDEPVVRRIVKVALERAGHTVVLAESGETAVDIFRRMKDRIDLVLLDWKMPVMDGNETLSRLREIRNDVRVIVSSGFAQSDAEECFREAGVAGYLQKPYRMSELVEMVTQAAAPSPPAQT